MAFYDSSMYHEEKDSPDKRQETTTRGFDVERVDAALPEIRERLKCRVWKSWDLNENQFFSCEDDDFPAWQFKKNWLEHLPRYSISRGRR